MRGGNIMNLGEMRATMRRDLHDEDAGNYRWTDNELERHINHAVKDFSGAIPFEQKAVKATTAESRVIDISDISDRIMVEAVEYPVDLFPVHFQRFTLWGNILTILGDLPDGSSTNVYYGKLHTLDASGSTIPVIYDDLIITGGAGYAAVEWSLYAINRVNVGGISTPEELLKWGQGRLTHFRSELKRLGRKNRVRVHSLFQPYHGVVSRSTDYGSV
jgi:hypothetical protein